MSVRWAKAIEHSGFDRRGVFTAVADAGFNGVQLPVDHITNLDDSSFFQLKKDLSASGMNAEVCASLFPADVVVSGQGFNLYVWAEYLKKAVGRIADLGCRRVVWNNGRARMMPDEDSMAGLREQTMQFLYVTAEIFATSGLALLVEPLSYRRTNFLNTIEETDSFLESVDRDNIGIAISLRDLDAIGLSPGSLERWKHRIGHVYLENPDASDMVRTAPSPSDRYDYGAFLGALRKIDYDGVVTLPSDATAGTLQFCHSRY